MIWSVRQTCTRDGCNEPAFGRGLCSADYQRARYHGELPSAPPVRECAQCGERFSSRKWNAQYCSRRCNEAARQARRAAETPRRAEACEHCGGSLEHKQKRARFCSDACGQAWRNAQIAAATLAKKSALAKLCRGCGGPVDPARPANSLYCSDSCKIRSRRHETYGLTKQELELLLAQHDRCAICRGEWGKKGPQVDHCHAIGKVRGVLCASCNNGLGRFADDPERLRAAADYLERHQT